MILAAVRYEISNTALISGSGLRDNWDGESVQNIAAQPDSGLVGTGRVARLY